MPIASASTNIFLLLSTISATAIAEAPYQLEWVRQIEVERYGYGNYLLLDNNGSVVVGVRDTIQSPSNPQSVSSQTLLVTLDPGGSETARWAIRSSVGAYGIAYSDSGDAFLAGPARSARHSVAHSVARYNRQAGEVWTASNAAANSSYTYALDVDASGDIYVAGRDSYRKLAQNTTTYATLKKYDQDGNVLWDIGETGIDATHWELAVTNEGEAYTVGGTEAGDMEVRRYSINGDLIWARQVDHPSDSYMRSIDTDFDGNAFVTWTSYVEESELNSGLLVEEIYLAKMSPTGEELWRQQVVSESLRVTDSHEGFLSFDVAVDHSGAAFVSGQGFGVDDSSTSMDVFLMKFGPDGTKLWEQTVVGDDYESSYDLLIDPKGNVYVTGYTESQFDGEPPEYCAPFVAKFSTTIPEPSSLMAAVLVGFCCLLPLLVRRVAA